MSTLGQEVSDRSRLGGDPPPLTGRVGTLVVEEQTVQGPIAPIFLRDPAHDLVTPISTWLVLRPRGVTGPVGGTPPVRACGPAVSWLLPLNALRNRRAVPSWSRLLLLTRPFPDGSVLPIPASFRAHGGSPRLRLRGPFASSSDPGTPATDDVQSGPIVDPGRVVRSRGRLHREPTTPAPPRGGARGGSSPAVHRARVHPRQFPSGGAERAGPHSAHLPSQTQTSPERPQGGEGRPEGGAVEFPGRSRTSPSDPSLVRAPPHSCHPFASCHAEALPDSPSGRSKPQAPPGAGPACAWRRRDADLPPQAEGTPPRALASGPFHRTSGPPLPPQGTPGNRTECALPLRTRNRPGPPASEGGWDSPGRGDPSGSK